MAYNLNQSVDILDITASQDINLTPGGTSHVIIDGDLKVNNEISTTSGDLELNSFTNLVKITGDAKIIGNLTMQGTILNTQSENVLLSSNYLHNNTNYITGAPQTGGITVRYDPTTTTDTVNGNFTIGTTPSYNTSRLSADLLYNPTRGLINGGSTFYSNVCLKMLYALRFGKLLILTSDHLHIS